MADIRDYYAQMISGGGSGSNSSGGYSQYGPFNNNFDIGRFLNYRNQIYQANAQANQAVQSPSDQSSWMDKSRRNADNYDYRKMNAADTFFAGLNSLTNTLSTGASETLGLGTFNPDEGFTGQNFLRFVANLPGQLLSSVPDAVTHAAEVVTGTPYTEADLESGLIPNYEMDADQRAASAGYLGMDLLGFIPGLGPEARAAGLLTKGVGAVARNAGKKEFGSLAGALGDASVGTIKGMGKLETAARLAGESEDAIRRARFGDAAIDTAAGAAFEGLQEAGQNIFEDLRYREFDENSWERAANAGAWGALGGGIVSGVSNYVNRNNQGKNEDPVTKETKPTSSEWEREKARNKTTESGEYTASVAKEVADKLAKNNEIPGSTSALSTVIDDGLDLTQAGLGEGDIHDMINANDGGESLKAIAYRFGVTPEEIVKIDKITNAKKKADAYNALIKAREDAGDVVSIVVGRNPDTGLGTALFDLHNVFVGHGIYMNRGAYMMFGGDVDGDQNQVHFGSGAQHNGYLTKNLVTPANGISRLKGDYLLFRNDEDSVKRFKDSLENSVLGLSFSEEEINNYTEKYRKCFDDDNKIDEDEMALLFDDMRAAVLAKYRRDQESLGETLSEEEQRKKNAAIIRDADHSVASFLHSIDTAERKLDKRASEILESFNQEEQAALKNLLQVVQDSTDNYLRSGDLKDNTHFANFAAALGYKVASVSTTGFPFFRQSGQVYYHSRKDERINFGNLDQSSIKSVFDAAIAFSFRLTEMGGEVENSIEGLFRVAIQDRVFTRMQQTSLPKVDIKSGWGAFKDLFVEVYDSYVETFNASMREQTTDSDARTVVGKSLKKKLKDEDASVREYAIARAFDEIFGSCRFDEIFDIDESHYLYGFSIDQGLDEFSVNPGAPGILFKQYPEFSSFWKKLLEHRNDKQMAVGSKIEEAVASTAKMQREMGELIESYENDNGETVYTVKTRDRGSLSAVVNALNILMGADNAIDLRIGTVESFINTKWGRDLLSGDESRMKNALLSIWLTNQYETIIDIATTHDINEEPEWMNKIKIESSRLADNSYLHMQIHVAINENNNLEWLKKLMDLDVSWEDKVATYEHLLGGGSRELDLLTAAMQKRESKMSTSEISNRIKQVNREINNAVKMSRAANKQVVDNILSDIDNGYYTADEAVQCMLEFAKDEYVESSEEAVASFVYSQRDIVKEMSDKGVTPASSDIIAQQAKIMFTGGNMSWLDELGVELGNISIGNFRVNRIQLLGIWTGSIPEIRLWDPSQDGFIYLTQKKLFAAAGIKIDEKPETMDYLDFLKEFPQLSAILSPQKLDVVGEGSSVTTKPGVSQPLDGAIFSRVKQSKEQRQQRSLKAQKRRIKQFLFRDPDWWGMLVASIDGLPEYKTPSKTKQAVLDAIDKHVNFILAVAQSPDGGMRQSKLEERYNEETFAQILGAINDLLGSTKMAQRFLQITGSVQSSFAKEAVDSTLSLMQISAFQSMATEEGFTSFSFDSDALTQLSELEGLPALFEGEAQSALNLAYALIGMIDPNSVDTSRYFNSNATQEQIEGWFEIQQKLINDEPNEDVKRDQQSRLDNLKERWNSTKKKGIVAYFESRVKYEEGQESTLKEVTDEIKDLLIPFEALSENGANGWTEAQWYSACERILKECHRSDEWTKDAKKEVKDAIKDGQLNKIRAYYNNVVVEREVQKLAFGSGMTINADAAFQTIEARRKMLDKAHEIKMTMEREGFSFEALQASSSRLPRLNFYYSDPETAYMSASAVMNANSGTVGSGIGIDGSMTKLIAAFGALPADVSCSSLGIELTPDELDTKYIGWSYLDDATGKTKRITASNIVRIQRSHTDSRIPIVVYDPSQCLLWSCEKCSPESHSPSNHRGNTISDALAVLANWMQENRHLQMKKRAGIISLMSGNLSQNSELLDWIKFEQREGQDEVVAAKNGILEALYKRRSELATFWVGKFNESKGLDLNREHAIMFANATTPIMEVRLVSGDTVYVSVSDLGTTVGFEEKYPNLKASQIIDCRPMIMSFQEVAAKITRGLADSYYGAVDQTKFSKEDVHKAARRAFEDWSSYKDDSLDIYEIFDGIVTPSASFSTGLAPDSAPTARMKWNERVAHAMDRVQRRKENFTPKPMSEKARNSIKAANSTSENSAGSDTILGSYVIAKYSSNKAIYESPFYDRYRNLDWKNGEDGNDRWISLDGGRATLVEMFEVDSFDRINSQTRSLAYEAYNRAFANGRPILIDNNIWNEIQLPQLVEDAAVNFTYELDGEKKIFWFVNPDYERLSQYYDRYEMKMATEFMHPDEITIAIGDRGNLGMPDSAHYIRSDYNPAFHYTGNSGIPLSSLLRTNNPITLVDNFSDIAKIPLSQISLDYYEDLDREIRKKLPENAELRQKAIEFISAHQNDSGKSNLLTNVQRGDCIGFVKAEVRGTTKYCPIFYDGSVPETASSLSLRVSRGNVRINFESNDLNYAGDETMKLDLYGVSYKSMGHRVTKEMEDLYWAVLKDFGFGLDAKPEYMFDLNALASRVFQMTDSIVQNNLFYYTRKVGSNFFFTINKDGSISRKAWLNVDDDILLDLCAGDRMTWKKVANGEIKLVKEDGLQPGLSPAEMNRTISRITSELLLNGGFPHLFFCPRDIVVEKSTGEDGLIKYSYRDKGIMPRDMTFRMASKYMSRDDTLKLFNLFDGRLCPPGCGFQDNFTYVFDDEGRMVNMHTKDGKPERVFALVGPHYYTSQGTVYAAPSRTAQYSNQHMVKRMMELGVYPKHIRRMISYLAMTVDENIDLNEDAESRLQKIDFENRERPVNKERYERIALNMRDSVYLSSIEREKEEFANIIRQIGSPLDITLEDLSTPYTKDDVAKRDLDNALANLNSVLHADGVNKLSLDEAMMLVRFDTGFTENHGRGTMKGLTYQQVIDSLKRMTSNIENGDLIIKGGTYYGRRGDIRGHIPVLPRELNAVLMRFDPIRSKYNGRIEDLIKDQEKEFEEVSYPELQKIESLAKRNALYRFADAVYYSNGHESATGHVLDDVYMQDIIDSIKKFGASGFASYDPNLVTQYEEMSELNKNYLNKVKELVTSRRQTVYEDKNGRTNRIVSGDARTIGTKILRNLTATRKAIGLSYVEMLPANIIERAANQGMQSIAMTLGQAGLSPYRFSYKFDAKILRNAVKDKDFKKIYSAYRTAELHGVGRDLLVAIHNGQDIDEAIKEVLTARNAFEKWQEKFTNIMSGNDIFIEGQMLNFLYRFAQRSSNEAKWWIQKAEGSNLCILEQQLQADPGKWFINALSGRSLENPGADTLLVRQCLEWAKRGDMAQRNVVSAVVAELSNRSAAFEFLTTAFVSPYFNYATNRFGRLMNWVAPVSTTYYLVTKFLTTGPGKNIPLGKGLKFGDLALEDVQFQANLKEALIIDMLHLGPQLMAFLLMGMAGAVEPPEDKDKWGNFKEWTVFGMRLDANWWIEDILGLALPMACFGKSAQLGEPRLDLIVNGLSYYLGNNPVTKVSDAVSALFDPFEELYRDYDNDVEGYAKAMGGPPSLSDMVNGKATTFGLSFVSQFITPGFVREIYNSSLDFEKDYKRIYQTDGTGRLTEAAKTDNKTQYTTYRDAMIRKYTKNNPVMGLLADLVMPSSGTGYRADEMPNRIIYDPEQMNSIEAFSLYEDPWTKTTPKSDQEQLQVCLAAVVELQSKSVDQLYSEGFMLDYDTKMYIGKWLWDNIATLNEQWIEAENSGALDYYAAGNGDFEEGRRIVNELKDQHYKQIASIKSLYYDKLWADKLKSPVQYNQVHTSWAQDSNGDLYATGFSPTWFTPVTFGPTETPGEYQTVMSRENDWQTESLVTGNPTGVRGLIPITAGYVSTPNIENMSEDGSDTGHSDIYKKTNASGASGSGSDGSSSSYPRSSGSRSGGGGSGSGGGGRSYVPSFYAPSVNLPRTNSSRIMNTDRAIKPSYDYLRPDFETKGSREAYRRSDI